MKGPEKKMLSIIYDTNFNEALVISLFYILSVFEGHLVLDYCESEVDLPDPLCLLRVVP